MLSVFQIFKVILGVIVFIFVMTFFLQITDMYAGIGERGESLEFANALGTTVKQTFISGNPTTFQGFTGFEFVVYEPPTLKFLLGRKTMAVPTFMLPTLEEMAFKKDCEEYGWYSFCWVYAYPTSFTVIFTPEENTPEVRQLISDIVTTLPDDIEFADCSGSGTSKGSKQQFMDFVTATGSNSMGGEEYAACNLSIPDHFRLVTITTDTDAIPRRNEIILVPSASGGTYKENVNGLWKLVDGTADTIRDGHYNSAGDVYFLLTTGQNALDCKNEEMKNELRIAADVMKRRTFLILDMMEKYNRQPCNECPTPFPKACGYEPYGDLFEDSELYGDFLDSLVDLNDDLENEQDYRFNLEESIEKYNCLKDAGCER